MSIGLALIILIPALWLSSRYYGVIEAVQGVSVLHSESELFVFIGHTKSVLSDTRFRLYGKELTSRLLVPETIDDDLLVVHFKDNQSLKLQMKGVGHSGSPFVYKGQVYWYGGPELGHRRTWKWNDYRFIELSEIEASSIYSQIKYVSDATRGEGWRECSLRKGQMTCQLKNQTIKVYEQDGSMVDGSLHMRVFLHAVETTNAPETLIDLKWNYRTISREEYLRLKATK